MSFTELDLHPSLLRTLSLCGYTEPTPIQARAIPLALAGCDLIASAPTGTGKTAAFVLPALQRLKTPRQATSRGPRVLVLTPTRELATQILAAVRRYCGGGGVAAGAILGGMPYREQLRMLRNRVDLVVATPGRLIDHLERGHLDLSSVELLVLDEADRMLDMGFVEPVERIASACPQPRQTLLLSATVDAATARLAGRLLADPQRVDVAGRRVTIDAIDQRLIHADDLGHKQRLLAHLISAADVDKAIIFAATKRDADRLACDLVAKGHAAAALHGDMKQSQRNRTIDGLRRGRVKLLVATDVAARGIDVPDISHVINFDLPRTAEDYVHRIGRTGRAGASGVACSLVTGRDAGQVRAIERFLGRSVPVHVVPGLEPTRRPGAGERHPPRPGQRPAGHRHGAADANRGHGPGSWRGHGSGGRGPKPTAAGRKTARLAPSS